MDKIIEKHTGLTANGAAKLMVGNAHEDVLAQRMALFADMIACFDAYDIRVMGTLSNFSHQLYVAGCALHEKAHAARNRTDTNLMTMTRVQALDAAMRWDAACVAGRWIAAAVTALRCNSPEAEIDALTGRALLLLSWPEMMAVVEAAESALLDGEVGRLRAPLDAYHAALGRADPTRGGSSAAPPLPEWRSTRFCDEVRVQRYLPNGDRVSIDPADCTALRYDRNDRRVGPVHGPYASVEEAQAAIDALLAKSAAGPTCADRGGPATAWLGTPPPGWKPGMRPPCVACGAVAGAPCAAEAVASIPRSRRVQLRWYSKPAEHRGSGAPSYSTRCTLFERGYVISPGTKADLTRYGKAVLAALDNAGAKPLSAAAIGALTTLLRGPAPRQDFNPGVVRLLAGEGLVEELELPSPYKTKATLVRHLRLTDLGTKRARALKEHGT